MPRRVTSAEFVISAAGPRDFPTDGRPEIAMVGRSNVGKSTLINALVGTTVARTSGSPGKTRLVNFYRVHPSAGSPFYLVDLPGYGHAGGGEKARQEFADLTAHYFQSRLPAGGETAAGAPVLGGIVLAIDARHPGIASDVEALRWASTSDLPFLLAATKVDKLKQSEKARLPRACESAFGIRPVLVSAQTGEGLDALWGLMREWIASQGRGEGQGGASRRNNVTG